MPKPGRETSDPRLKQPTLAFGRPSGFFRVPLLRLQMGDRTGIEWTDATWNPMTGCTKISSGCDHCYAHTLAHTKTRDNYLRRLPVKDTVQNRADPFAPRFWEDRVDQPLRWRKPMRIFVNSMSDV